MKKRHAKIARKLASEGKQISKILHEDLPKCDYWDIYLAVHETGGKSALGVKRTITNRLNTLSETRKKDERQEIIEEIEELVWHLYESVKTNQKKLSAIRKTLDI